MAASVSPVNVNQVSVLRNANRNPQKIQATETFHEDNSISAYSRNTDYCAGGKQYECEVISTESVIIKEKDKG